SRTRESPELRGNPGMAHRHGGRRHRPGRIHTGGRTMSIWTELVGLDYRPGYVDAGGIRTRAVQTGPEDGEHVVFLHGTSGHLEAFVRNLPAHAQRYRCHAIDMLGHGYTAKPDYPYDIPRYVAHL